jgi:hypothetical protein
MSNLVGKLSEIKFTRRERRYLVGGNVSHAEALRRYNRALRADGREVCRAALLDADGVSGSIHYEVGP